MAIKPNNLSRADQVRARRRIEPVQRKPIPVYRNASPVKSEAPPVSSHAMVHIAHPARTPPATAHANRSISPLAHRAARCDCPLYQTYAELATPLSTDRHRKHCFALHYAQWG